jgi:hypothetical protein
VATERVGGAQVDADRKLALMRLGRHARFGNLQQRHRISPSIRRRRLNAVDLVGELVQEHAVGAPAPTARAQSRIAHRWRHSMSREQARALEPTARSRSDCKSAQVARGLARSSSASRALHLRA